MNIKIIEGVSSELIFPSETVVKLSIKYSKASNELKNYLESTIGDTPFDLIKTIKISNLSRTKVTSQ
ncbi:hypothetical protein [sulfur-oxidizing endosymbiont of Gigantopelta aegis]|uniref:hypothetical protein n=1 Tax=sulfur-oxidizing endosymbiont of Gigantopelta aegis TaxID=2794934 RepID=UPI0018DCD39C|nr:hypothetical protein [sulfur-oxidizing endosymbiont of Gigantopelta aegis]